jgi:hypothetical protein
MSHRYAPLPDHGHEQQVAQHDREAEMQAAFDYSDDEDEGHNATETQPLNTRSLPTTTQLPAPLPASAGTYNFETADYDFPPPGSPPRPSTVALPNEFGNSNGLIPTFHPPPDRAHNSWVQRTLGAALPAAMLARIGLGSHRPPGPVGGGTNNDGVFANVTAKPSVPVRIQDGDNTYVVPEDTRPEAPPSYASAQADAVPPYWETTIHAPFAPDSEGDLVIDSLPTGSLFSFCWNLLVSLSFQFVGFLLTYLLHTSHAARLGSRAGLGVTLIQYGFALRGRLENADGTDGVDWSDWTTGDAAAPEASSSSIHPSTSLSNVTWSTPMANVTEEQGSIMMAGATTEWLSFFMMTLGWFVLLTSLLGFWRIKRWERGILASRSNASAAAPASGPLTSAGIVSQLEHSLGLRTFARQDLYDGFGLGGRRRDESNEASTTRQNALHSGESEAQPMLTIEQAALNNPALARAVANERRLHRDLREAGLL